MLRKYRSIGLRRDFNLNDVENKTKSLDNLLDNLAFPNETFDSNDLFIVLEKENESISDTEVTTEDISNFAGTTKTFSKQIEISNNEFISVQENIEPLVTLKDQINNFKLTTGEIPWIQGGDGLKATIIPIELLNATSKSTNGDTIYNKSGPQNLLDEIIGPEYFWNSGSFYFNGNIENNFQNENGIIQWEGFYSPGVSKIDNLFEVYTNGFFIAEIREEDETNYKVIKNFYDETRTLDLETSISSNGSLQTLFVGDEIIYVGKNDVLIKVNDGEADELDLSNNETQITITDINLTEKTITLSESLDFNGDIETLTFNFETSGDFSQYLNLEFNLPTLPLGKKIAVRFTSWWTRESIETKFVNFNHNYNSGIYIPHTFFYTNFLNDDDFGKESINYFFNNHLQPKKQKTNKSIKIDNSVYINYDPPLQTNEKYIGSTLITHNGYGNFTSSTNIFSEENVQRGDYILVIDGNEYYVYQISEIYNSKEIFVELKANTNYSSIPDFQDNEAYVLKNNGLIGIFQSIDSTGPVLMYNIDPYYFDLENVRVDNLMSTFDVDNFVRITSTSEFTDGIIAEYDDFQFENSNTASVMPVDGIVFIYHDKGLIDDSKKEFCKGVVGKTLLNDLSPGDFELELSDVNGLFVNMYVQFQDKFSPTTQIASINTSENKVQLNLSLASGVTIDGSSTITFVPPSVAFDGSGNIVNKENCVIPLDLSPPFQSTAEGLKTVGGGNGIEVANTLSLESLTLVLDSNNITELTSFSNNDFNEFLEFSSANNTYRFLIN